MDNNNSVAKALSTTAVIIFVGGFIGGIVLGSINKVVSTDYLSSDLVFNWSLMLTSWFSCFFAGMFFVAMSEVVDLLNRISLQLKEKPIINTGFEEMKWEKEKAKTKYKDSDLKAQSEEKVVDSTTASEKKQIVEKPPAIFKSRSEARIECPNCHKEQMSNRNSCYSCGTRFIFSDEQ